MGAQMDFSDWPNPASIRSYLRRTGQRRRRCLIYERNPYWNGLLRNKAEARDEDPATSQDAAESIPEGDVFEARLYVDAILARGEGIISLELREYVLRGIAQGTIDSNGYPAHVRAESIRRRFSDLCN